MQAYTIYVHEVDPMSNHLIVIRPLAHVFIENMASYVVAVVMAIYSKKTANDQLILLLWFLSINSH